MQDNMNNQETPAEFKDKFLLSFVEMGWADPSMVDPRYKDWTGGRMEIHDYESEFEIDERPFCTPYTREWQIFKGNNDLRWVDKNELAQIIKTLKEKFYRADENGDPIL